jgi:hypothetical protein
MAARSGVSLGSIKRFEGTGEIALFSRKNYQSIDEIINAK